MPLIDWIQADMAETTLPTPAAAVRMETMVERLHAHLEEEVALSEFAGAELAALAEAGFNSMPAVMKVHGGLRDGSA